MNKFKSSILMVMFLSACETYVPSGQVQQLLPVSASSGVQNTEVQALNTPQSRIAPVGQIQPQAQPQSRQQPQPRTGAEVAFIKAQLNALQPRSIAENREYCGFLGILPNGDYAISPARRGAPAGCTPDNPPGNLRVIASYHTHAAYAPRYDSEVPSSTDLEGDISEGINGYVSTPGGRLWFNDAAAQRTVQICGVGCLFSDPRFQPERVLVVGESYSLAGLRARQN